jgi:hypothetical protein
MVGKWKGKQSLILQLRSRLAGQEALLSRPADGAATVDDPVLYPSSAACRHASVIGSGLVLVEDL